MLGMFKFWREAGDSSITEWESSWDQLLLILNDEEAVMWIVENCEPSILSHEQRDSLEQLYSHFCQVSKPVTTENGGGVSPVEVPQIPVGHAEHNIGGLPGMPTNGLGKPPPSQRVVKKFNGEMMKLTRDVHLPLPIQRFIDSHGPDAQLFLTDKCSVKKNFANLSHDVGGAFLAIYDYARDLEERSIFDKVRWSFTMIFFYDLCKMMDPNFTARRFGPKTKEKFIDFIDDLFQSDSTKIEAVLEDADRWSRYGLKLNQLCHEFGDGCILILARHFSSDFLENKYRESKGLHDEVFDSLRNAGLQAAATRPGVKELAENIRKSFFLAFKTYFDL